MGPRFSQKIHFGAKSLNHRGGTGYSARVKLRDRRRNGIEFLPPSGRLILATMLPKFLILLVFLVPAELSGQALPPSSSSPKVHSSAAETGRHDRPLDARQQELFQAGEAALKNG